MTRDAKRAREPGLAGSTWVQDPDSTSSPRSLERLVLPPSSKAATDHFISPPGQDTSPHPPQEEGSQWRSKPDPSATVSTCDSC